MLDRLIHALVKSPNEAADDLLLQALRLGVEPEQNLALDLLLQRKTAHGLGGVIALRESLPEPLQERILRDIRHFHRVLSQFGRAGDPARRLAAIRLIAEGRQGKLAYILSENLHDSDETYSKAAMEAILSLAKWVWTETRQLQKHDPQATDRAARYTDLLEQREEIESAVARAMNLHRGQHAQDLLRAALLLADWPGSRTLAILQTARHGGQGAMLRRLQQPPHSEHVEAFLLAGARGHLRGHFGSVFSHIDEAPVLDALLRRTHWLRDAQLDGCLRQVSRGVWLSVPELTRDLERRGPTDAGRIGEWIAACAMHDVEQDERLSLLLDHTMRGAEANPGESLEGRLRLLRVAMRRGPGGSVRLLQTMLGDPDERIVRLAAREIVRRRPTDFENMLMKLMAGAAPSVRRVIGRSIGQAGFEQFWQRFDRLDPATRRQGGRAMLKLLPDAVRRLHRRATAGPAEQRVKALQMAHELGVADGLAPAIRQLCADPNPRVRSKAASLLGEVTGEADSVLVEQLLHDPDARVRANVIETIEQNPAKNFLAVLAERAVAANGRERANAIKAMCRMKVGPAAKQLQAMLQDQRPEHRISALWVLRQIGWWQLVNEVGRIAKSDDNIRVRRYALGVLRTVADLLRERKRNAG